MKPNEIKKESPSTRKDSTPKDRKQGKAIVRAAFGGGFSVDFNFPKNVGVQGDERVYGDTVAITGLGNLSSIERRQWYEDRVTHDVTERDVEADEQGRVFHGDDELGAVSRRLTNRLPAVTKVLLDITPKN